MTAPTQASLLDLIATDHTHRNDRTAIINAIREAVHHHGTVISSNEIRRYLPAWVQPHLIGATTSGLVSSGVLTAYGPPVRSDDTRGRNAGRWIPRYAVDVTALERVV